MMAMRVRSIPQWLSSPFDFAARTARLKAAPF
jgi:hypothetical protein